MIRNRNSDRKFVGNGYKLFDDFGFFIQDTISPKGIGCSVSWYDLTGVQNVIGGRDSTVRVQKTSDNRLAVYNLSNTIAFQTAPGFITTNTIYEIALFEDGTPGNSSTQVALVVNGTPIGYMQIVYSMNTLLGYSETTLHSPTEYARFYVYQFYTFTVALTVNQVQALQNKGNGVNFAKTKQYSKILNQIDFNREAFNSSTFSFTAQKRFVQAQAYSGKTSIKYYLQEYFDGVDDTRSVNNSQNVSSPLDLEKTDSFTMAFAFTPDSATGLHQLFGKEANDFSTGYACYTNGDKFTFVVRWAGSSGARLEYPVSIQAYHRYIAVVTYTGTSDYSGFTGRLYDLEDNNIFTTFTVVGASSIASTIRNTQPLVFGDRPASPLPYAGNITHWCLFNTSVTTTQMLELKDRILVDNVEGFSLYGSNCTSYFKRRSNYLSTTWINEVNSTYDATLNNYSLVSYTTDQFSRRIGKTISL